ncbi:MAG: PEGA domain-containing protein [Spirochaetes bacterium]|nr:PEGA domain-containing protein [Spirochaetota bacterium]
MLKSILFVLIISLPLLAKDRITLDNGDIIECSIVSQTNDMLTYAQNGVQKQLDKSKLKKLELDIDIDKYYLAAMQESDPKLKLLYLRKSKTHFPENTKSRAQLSQLLVLKGERKEAAELCSNQNVPEFAVSRALIALTEGRANDAIDTLSGIDETKLEDSDRAALVVTRSFAAAFTGDTAGAVSNLAQAKIQAPEQSAALIRSLTGGKSPAEYRKTLESAVSNTNAAANVLAVAGLMQPPAVPNAPSFKTNVLIAARTAVRRSGVLSVTLADASVRAAVYIDGRESGSTPFSMTLTNGTYRVKVYREGYLPKEIPVTVIGTANDISVALIRGIGTEEATMKRDAALSGAVRNGLIAGGCLGVTAAGIVLGSILNNQGDQQYDSYKSDPITESSTAKGDLYSSTYNTADAMFMVAETGIVLGAVFLIWGGFDFFNYYSYAELTRKTEKKSAFMLLPVINPVRQNCGVYFTASFQ